jgi:hypothetical protein
VAIPAPVDVSSFYFAFAEEAELDGSSGRRSRKNGSNEHDEGNSDKRIALALLAVEDIPLRRFPHLQLEFVTSQQQFIDHMPPFRSRVIIPDPLHVVTARELGFSQTF